MNLRDEDRELLLSQYLDGELDAGTSAAVEARLKDDAAWREEFAQMKRDDAAVARTARRFHRDERTSKAVVERLRAAKRAPARHKSVAHARRQTPVFTRFVGFVGRMAALVAFGFVAFYGWKFYNEQDVRKTEVAVAPPGVVETTPPPATVSVAPAEKNTIVVTEEVRELSWPDGTQIWARKGSTISSLGERSLKLSGEAYFHVAKNEAPFTVITGENTQAQALGTRFDVKTAASGARVRVAEGHVRVQAGDEKVDAFGGTEVSAELKTKAFDPRKVAAAWPLTGRSAAHGIPPWQQANGSAEQSRVTPLNGPSGLVANPEKFFAFSEGAAAVSGAIVSAAGDVYVQRGAALEVLASGTREWTVLQSRLAPVAAVLTSSGLVVAVAENQEVIACNAQGARAWSHAEQSAVRGLCVTADETILVTLQSGVTSLNGRTGRLNWFAPEPVDASGSAAVARNGKIFVVSKDGRVSVLDQAGKLQKSIAWNRTPSQPAVIVKNGGAEELWLTTRDSMAAAINTDSYALTERQLKKALACGPIGSGLYGGTTLLRLDESTAANPPARESMVALAQDGRGQVFAAYAHGVVRLQPTEGSSFKEMEFANTAAGEIVPGGLAIAPGKLIVTTTRGVQVFE